MKNIIPVIIGILIISMIAQKKSQEQDELGVPIGGGSPSSGSGSSQNEKPNNNSKK